MVKAEECITGTGARGGPRLVAFGAFAGYAGRSSAGLGFTRGFIGVYVLMV